MDARSEYALGISPSEIARLKRQNEAVGQESAWLLDRVGVVPGSRVADVGCGPLGILEMLSRRVGPAGAVVGVDVNEVMIEKARGFARHAGLDNVALLRADAAATGLPRASFDLVHERLVLINVPRPAGIVAEMVAIARPGAFVLLEDIDGVSWACDPPHPAWDRLYGAFVEVFRRRGCDPQIGRRLPRLLAEAGAVNVKAKVHQSFHAVDHAWRHLLLYFSGLVREQAVAEGLLDAAEIDALLADLKAHLDDPRTQVVSPMFVQAWGRAPGI